MKRKRSKKLLIVIILTVLIAGLSIGLATFSNVLTISSSATVKPNEGEYKVTIYGVSSMPDEGLSLSRPFEELEPYLSKNFGLAVFFDDKTVWSPAYIDNNNFTISNLNVALYSGSLAALYVFMIRNEGAYDVYIDLAQFKKYNDELYSKTCTAKDSSKQELVDTYCDNVKISFGPYSSLEKDIISMHGYEYSYRIVPGEHVYFAFSIGSVLDSIKDMEANFDVAVEDVKLEFSATDKYAE